jgi:hypothetical protein
VIKNKVLRQIFGPKREKVAGDWERLCKEQLHDLYASPNIIRVIKEDGMGGGCSTQGRDEKCLQNFSLKM